MATDGEDLRDNGRGGDPWARIAKMARALERYKTMAGNAIEERDALAEKIEQMQAAQAEWDEERKGWEAKADANVERQRAEKLAQQIRDIKHRDAFYKQARAAGAPSDVIEDLWALSGFKPDKDEVNEAAMTELVEGLKGSKPRWFEDHKAAEAAQKADVDAGRKPSPAAGRGEALPGPRGKTYTTADLHDPKNVMDPDFMREYNIAFKEGRVQRVGVDAGL